MTRIGARSRTAHGLCCILLGLTGLASAYIPAQATNDSSLVSVTNSSISLSWDEGSYSVPISFQLTGSGSLGFSQGAIVHYSEYNASDPPTLSPFIALISCDRNITNTTLENDIFTMANSSGAIAALLYTTTAQACLINPDYANPDNFDRVLDIYTTVRMSSAKLIESQWNEVNSSYYWYNSGMLNASNEAINQYVGGRQRIGPGFLMASLIANTSNPLNGTDGDGGGNGCPGCGGGGGGGGGPNTSTAMIVLYSITGCVCALFCIVIGSGAIRAFRHPERYSANPARFLLGGGRAANEPSNGPGAPPQRAGLGRAMLDSFPLIKFGASAPPPSATPGQAKEVDIERDAEDWRQGEGEGDAVEMDKLPPTPETETPHSGGVHTVPVYAMQISGGPADTKHAEALGVQHEDATTASNYSGTEHAPSYAHGVDAAPAPEADTAEPIDPSALGRETCPICIFDFENGDDLRVLPCEGRHRFHQACVDPWLLELSSSCPICRADFGQLEHMAESQSGTSSPPPMSAPPNPGMFYTNPMGSPSTNPSSPRILHQNSNSPAARFSRYLRFAQHRRERNRASRRARSRSQAGVAENESEGDLAPRYSVVAGSSSGAGLRSASTASLSGTTTSNANATSETGGGAPQLPALPRSGSTMLM